MTAVRVPATKGHARMELLRGTYLQMADAYDHLVEGICHQAAKDLKDKKNDYLRFDAMDFFRSWWFYELTGLDGEEVITRLLDNEGGEYESH